METSEPSKLKLFEYGKSFVQSYGNKDNNPRFLIEARCTMIDRGNVDEYYLAARCKGEHTYSAVELFEKNSFEFFPLFHKNETVVFRKFKYYIPGEKDEYKKTYKKKEIWSERKFLIKEIEGKLLNGTKEIINATEEGKELMGRLVVTKGSKAIIDFPIKTINTFKDQWQVDTGSIVYPNFYKYPVEKILSFSLAFVAMNHHNIAEVITEGLIEPFGQQPISIAHDDAVIKIEHPEFYIYAI